MWGLTIPGKNAHYRNCISETFFENLFTCFYCKYIANIVKLLASPIFIIIIYHLCSNNLLDHKKLAVSSSFCHILRLLLPFVNNGLQQYSRFQCLMFKFGFDIMAISDLKYEYAFVHSELKCDGIIIWLIQPGCPTNDFCT